MLCNLIVLTRSYGCTLLPVPFSSHMQKAEFPDTKRQPKLGGRISFQKLSFTLSLLFYILKKRSQRFLQRDPIDPHSFAESELLKMNGKLKEVKLQQQFNANSNTHFVFFSLLFLRFRNLHFCETPDNQN